MSSFVVVVVVLLHPHVPSEEEEEVSVMLQDCLVGSSQEVCIQGASSALGL